MRALIHNGDISDFGLFLAGEIVVAATLLAIAIFGAA